MPVIIDQVTTDVTVDRGGTTDAASAATPPETEAQTEELRAVIREILREEIDRYLRLAVPPR